MRVPTCAAPRSPSPPSMSAPICTTPRPSFMPLGGQDSKRIVSAMRRAAPWFRTRVGGKSRTNATFPEIRFEIDKSFDAVDRIDSLLRRPDVARDLKTSEPPLRGPPMAAGKGRQGRRLDRARQAAWAWARPRRSAACAGCSAPRRQAMAALSIRWPRACCRSRWARPPRPCPGSWTGGRNTAYLALRRSPLDRGCRGRGHSTSDVRPTDARSRLPGSLHRYIEQRHRLIRRSKSREKRAYDLARAVENGRTRAPAGDHRNGWSWSGRPDTDHADFWLSAARAPISGLSAATWRVFGTVGHLSALRRTRAGPFTESQAISLPKQEALGHIPALFGVLAP